MKTIEAICIGNELLDGRVADVNAAALGAFLSARGRALERVQFVPDELDAIVDALKLCKADVVVVGGGLGPTSDDITRDAAAAWCGCKLRPDEDSLRRIRERFEARGRVFTENNSRQAMFPVCATILPTSVGTAPGFAVEHGGRTALFFPGVPREFTWYLTRELEKVVEAGDRVFRSIQFHGIGESALETQVSDVVEPAIEAGAVVSYRASYPIIEFKVSGESALVDRTAEAVAARLRPWLVAEDAESLPSRLGRLLMERGETVTTAESCTAGGIAALITEVSGSSAWFGRGYVTYANEAKVDEVGVLESVLLAHGAVSAQTVCQMAAGARARARSTYAVAVSGIAGPSGGTAEKPVGTVHFALSTPDGTFHKHVLFQAGDRALVRAGTAYTALAMLLWHLEDRMNEHDVNGPFEDRLVWSEHGISLAGEA